MERREREGRVLSVFIPPHHSAYRLLAVWDLHCTSPESRLEAPRKATDVGAYPALYMSSPLFARHWDYYAMKGL
jgi:hypothetical protein